MPYAMKISHQDFHVSKALPLAWAQQGHSSFSGTPGSPGATPPVGWPGKSVSDLWMSGGRAEQGLQRAGCGLHGPQAGLLSGTTMAPLPGRGTSCWLPSRSSSRPSGWRCCRSLGRCKCARAGGVSLRVQKGKGCGLCRPGSPCLSAGIPVRTEHPRGGQGGEDRAVGAGYCGKRRQTRFRASLGGLLSEL